MTMADELLEDFALRYPADTEKRGGETFISVEVVSITRLADFSRDGADHNRPDFVAGSCSQARSLISGAWGLGPAAIGTRGPDTFGGGRSPYDRRGLAATQAERR